MPVAIDTSVLVAAERLGDLDQLLPPDRQVFYIPAHAAAEFLVGTHPPVTRLYRERARRIYQNRFRDMVSAFDEADAAQLAALSAELRASGQSLRWFDAAIAATALARGDELFCADSDFDRRQDRITLLKYLPGQRRS